MDNDWDTGLTVKTSLDPDLIERIVQEVVRRLLERGVEIERSQSQNPSSDFCVDSKVVALASLEGKLNGIRRVIVGPRAIVTPAVNDELRDREIELIRR